jgi:hypothetical protein
MSDELSALNLRDDFAEVLTTDDAKRWGLDLAGPLEVWAKMSPASKPEEIFQARLLWTRYPDDLPSLKYRDPATGQLDSPKAWPQLPGFRPNSLDACVSYCSEGFGLHPEWRNDRRYRWDSHGNPLLRVLRILQQELDEHFSGRYPG